MGILYLSSEEISKKFGSVKSKSSRKQIVDFVEMQNRISLQICEQFAYHISCVNDAYHLKLFTNVNGIEAEKVGAEIKKLSDIFRQIINKSSRRLSSKKFGGIRTLHIEQITPRYFRPYLEIISNGYTESTFILSEWLRLNSIRPIQIGSQFNSRLKASWSYKKFNNCFSHTTQIDRCFVSRDLSNHICFGDIWDIIGNDLKTGAIKISIDNHCFIYPAIKKSVYSCCNFIPKHFDFSYIDMWRSLPKYKKVQRFGFCLRPTNVCKELPNLSPQAQNNRFYTTINSDLKCIEAYENRLSERRFEAQKEQKRINDIRRDYVIYGTTIYGYSNHTGY